MPCLLPLNSLGVSDVRPGCLHDHTWLSFEEQPWLSSVVWWGCCFWKDSLVVWGALGSYLNLMPWLSSWVDLLEYRRASYERWEYPFFLGFSDNLHLCFLQDDYRATSPCLAASPHLRGDVREAHALLVHHPQGGEVLQWKIMFWLNIWYWLKQCLNV